MEEESVAKSKQKEDNVGKEEESSSRTEDISSEIQNSNGIGSVKTEKKSSPESKMELSSTSEESASGTDSKTSQKSNNEDTLLGNFDILWQKIKHIEATYELIATFIDMYEMISYTSTCSLMFIWHLYSTVLFCLTISFNAWG